MALFHRGIRLHSPLRVSLWWATLLAALLLAACQAAVPPPASAQTGEPAVQETEPPEGTAIAFVRDHTLYIQTGAPAGTPVAVESCTQPGCLILYPQWSPDATHLLYYVGSTDSATPQQIRVAGRDGETQTVTAQAAYLGPASWSPDGSAIVYLQATDRYAAPNEGPAQRILEVWTVAWTDDGKPGAPVAKGEISFGEGCGGGGRSPSALAYENEGGFAYGYLAGIVAWTPGDLLLYRTNCTSLGVGRYDLAAGRPLDPYPVPLRSLSLNAARDGWVAVDDQGQMVTGTPAALEIAPVALPDRPELVFYGHVTGRLYYTTLETTERKELLDQAAALDPSILIQPYFDFTVPTLNVLDPATGTVQRLYGGDGYAYGRVTELPDGSLLFSRVEDNRELAAALEAGTLTPENWQSYLPTTDLLQIPAGGGAPLLWLADAAQAAPVAP